MSLRKYVFVFTAVGYNLIPPYSMTRFCNYMVANNIHACIISGSVYCWQIARTLQIICRKFPRYVLTSANKATFDITHVKSFRLFQWSYIYIKFHGCVNLFDSITSCPSLDWISFNIICPVSFLFSVIYHSW